MEREGLGEGFRLATHTLVLWNGVFLDDIGVNAFDVLIGVETANTLSHSPDPLAGRIARNAVNFSRSRAMIDSAQALQ